jgi:hypothetical protein
MITHKLKDNILHIKFEGNIVYDELIELSTTFSDQIIDRKVLLLLYDLRDCVLNFSVSDYTKISSMALGSTKKYKAVKAAFIVTKPRMTAMLTIFSQLSKSNHTLRKVFSTEDAAILWLRQFREY